MTETEYQIILEHILPSLQNVDAVHPKLAVFYSGGNAVGKTSLSNHLVKTLNATAISNDAIRALIMEKWPRLDKMERNKLMWDASMRFYVELPQYISNGLIIRDGVVDWYHDQIIPIFEKNGYSIFVVSFELSEEKIISLIEQRGDTHVLTAERAKEMIPDHAAYQKAFRGVRTPDYVINDDGFGDWSSVAAAIQKQLDSMTK